MINPAVGSSEARSRATGASMTLFYQEGSGVITLPGADDSRAGLNVIEEQTALELSRSVEMQP